MILAAPLVIPFAEAVGISIATLGMAKGADMVNDYIQENPEESAMILKTLVPNLGIGQIFMNKEKISLEDLDEMTDEEAQDLSKEEKAELMKQAGKKRDRELSISTSEKIGLSGPGKEKQDIEYEVDERYDEGGVEDAPKPKFDYKKFFKKRYADGGAIGIEVLFGPKRDEFQKGGRIGFNMGGAQFTSGGNISPGTDKKGNVRNDNPFTGGGGGDGPPPVIIPKDNTPKPITFNEVTGKKMLPADLAIQKQFLNLVKKKGYESGLDTEADDLYAAYRSATGLDNFNQNVLVDSTTNILDKEKDGVFEKFVDRNTTFKDLDTGKSTKQLVVETPTGLIQRTVRPSGIMENNVPQKFGAPQSLSVDPYSNNIIGSELKDGGRVGLFMGGPALEGQALNIYNSMNSYGFSDQEIANALQGQGLYTPGGSTPDAPTTIQPIGYQGGGGGGGTTELQETFTKDLSQDPRFNYLEPTAQANKYRFDRSVEPRKGLMGLYDKTKNFFAESKFFQPKVRGTLGTRLANQPKLPIPSFASFLSNYTSPFNLQSKNYNPLMESQLNFAELGDNLIGRDPNTGGLKYGSGSVLSGKNVISGFGTNNYETALRNFISKMNANKRISTERKTARLAAAKAELEALQAATKAAKQAQYGKTDYGQGVGGQSYSGDAVGAPGLGFGIGATTGGPVSNRTGKGRTDYSKGGLATMFVEKR